MYDVEPGHPDWNRLVRCTTCGAGAQQEHLRRWCGLRGEMLDWHWANTVRTAGNSIAYDVAQLLAEHPARFYTLLGDYGVGKTRLLACIVNAGRQAGWTAVYTTTAQLLDHFRSAYDPKREEIGYDGLFERISTARILCLDEFDRWNPTPWAQEKFFQLIDARYREQNTMLTCFAANARLSDLPGYIRSRMEDANSYLFELTGEDVRRIVR